MKKRGKGFRRALDRFRRARLTKNGAKSMIGFDHLKLVRRQPTEMKRFREWVLGAQPGEVSEVRVEHEADGSCCRREPWNTTAARIITALEPTVTQVLMNLNQPEAIGK